MLVQKKVKTEHEYKPNGSGFLFADDVLGSPPLLVVHGW
jgi:hypothetical protein